MGLREIYEDAAQETDISYDKIPQMMVDLEKKKAKQEKNRSIVSGLSYGDILGTKFEEGAGVGSTFRYIADMADRPRWAEELNTDELDALHTKYNTKNTIDQENLHYLQSSIYSEADFEKKYNDLLKSKAVHLWEDENPWKSFATDILTLTPDALVAGTATKAWSRLSPTSYVAKNNTAGNRLLTSGAFELGFTALMDTISKKDQTISDWILSPLLVGSMGAFLGGNGELTNAARLAFARKFDLEGLESKVASLTSQEEINAVTAEHIKGIVKDEKTLQGASPEEVMDFFYDQEVKDKESKGLFNKLRVDLAHSLKTSESPILNRIGNSAWIDRTLQGNRQGLWAAEEKGNFVEKTLITRTNQTMKNAEANIGKLLNKGAVATHFSSIRNDLSMIIGNVAARRRFEKINDEEATQEIYDALKTYTASENEQELLSVSKSIVQDITEESFNTHSILKTGGKHGFDDKDGIEAVGTYFPTMYKPTTAQNFMDMGLSKKDHKEFLHRSLLSQLRKQADQDGEKLELSNEDHAVISSLADSLSDSIWKNKDAFVDPSKSYDSMLKTILDNPDFDGANLSPYTIKRTNFDYSFEHTFKNKNGKEVTIGFEDLVDTHYENVMNKYARKMSGATVRENINVTLKANQKDFDIAFKHYAAVRQATDDRIEKLQQEITNQRELFEALESDERLTLQRLAGVDLGASQTTKQLDEYKLAIERDEAELVKLKNMVAEAESKVKPLIPGSSNVKKTLNELMRLAKGGPRSKKGKQSKQSSLIDEYPEFKNFILKAWTENKKQDKSLRVGDLYEKVKQAVENKRKDGYFSDKHISGEVARGQELTEDMIDKTDFEAVMHSALREKVNLSTDENIARVQQAIHSELYDAGLSKKDVDTELARFDDVVKEWKGMATSQTPDGRATQGMKISKNMNIFRLLGQTGFTMSHEGGGILFRVGAKNFLEFGSARALKNQLMSGEMDDRLAQEIQTHTGLGADMLDRIGGNIHDHLYNISGQNGARKLDAGLNALENISDKASEATLMLGGIKPITAYLEMTMAKDSVNNLTMALARKGGLSTTDRKNLNEMGISDDMLTIISDSFSKHGTTEAKTWSKGHKVKMLNLDKWDEEAKQALIFSTRRLTNVMVQKSTLGDKVSWTGGNVPFVGQSGLFKNSLMGQVALELKDYMVTAYVAQLGRALGRQDLHTAGSLMAQIAAGATALHLKNFVNYGHDEEKYAEANDPAKFWATVANQSTISSYAPIVSDLASDVLFNESLFTDSRFHGPITSGLASSASLDLVNKAYNILKMGPEALHNIYEGEKAMSNKMIRDLFGTTLGNTVPAKAFINYMQDPYE